MAGVTGTEIAAVVISHLHPDHAAGLPGLIQQFRLRRNPEQPPVSLWLPAEAEAGIARTLAFFGLSQSRLRHVVRLLYYQPERSFVVGEELQITPLPNAHLSPSSRGPLHSSFCLLAEYSAHRLFYSGDLSSLEEVSWPPPAAVDLAVVDAGHLPAEQVAAAAFGRGAARVLLTHLEEGERTTREASANLLWACDGMQLGW
jgi:ribonuclease BN (tRNA processing enzyme)